jgi:PAS domain S-box-containing protein
MAESTRRTEELEEIESLRTRLAEAEAKLAAGELYRRQADLMRLSFDAVITWRLDSGIESWNLGAERLYGYSESEALGHRTHRLLQTIHPRPWAEIEAELLAKGLWEGELSHRAKDGKRIIVSARKQVVRDPDGSGFRVLEINRDITEKKQVESRLRRFYETDLFAILYWRIDGGVIDANDKFLLMTGYTREDVRAGRLNWAAMTPPEYKEADEDARRQIREQGFHRPFEKEYIRKDGTRVWGLFSAAAWEDNRDEGVSIILDITARKHAEAVAAAALAQTERTAAQLRTVIDNMAERVYVCGAQGEAILANEAYRRSFGTAEAPPFAEINGMIEIFTPDGRPLPRCDWPLDRVMRGETIRGVEVMLHFKPTGLTRVLSCNGAPILDRNGDLVMAVLTTNDITERTEAARALRRSNERLELAAEVAKLGEWEVNLTGHTASRSLRHAHIFGYPDASSPWTLETFMEHVLPERRAEVERSIQGCISTGGADFETEIRRADGELRWIWVRGRAWPKEGEPARMFGTVIDITERKRTEQALLQNEKLASVGRMASTIAHEINNPLEAIGNAIYLAKTSPNISEVAKSYLDLAAHELERVAHITRQTLAFHRETLRPAPIDLAESVQDLLRLFGPRVSSRGVTLQTRFAQVPRPVFTRGEITQVVANLLSNSLDATPRAGRILIRIKPCLLADGSRAASLSIADTGCGIPAAGRERIFEPFYTTKEVVGTGLGLWVTRQLVEKHGAVIRVRSKLGCGTVFSIVFRRVEVGAEQVQ